jgi:hydroxymethylpyrimidine kinase/phosphomethylpyrimidine kinase
VAVVARAPPPTTLAQQREAAEQLAALGPGAVVVKGGHAVTDTPGEAVDVVAVGGTLTELRAPRVPTRNNHGSGCSFGSAVTAGLAQGMSTMDAIAAAKQFVHRAVTGGATWTLGKGHGPLDHFGWSTASRHG